MSRFDAELITRPGLQEQLHAVDPWVFYVLMTPSLAQSLYEFEAGVITPERLTLTSETGENKEFIQTRVIAYSEDGTLIHVRQAEDGTIGAIVGQLERPTESRRYTDVRMRYQAIPQYGVPSEIRTTTYTLNSLDDAPLLTDAARPVEASALSYAVATLQRQRDREVVTVSSAGWSYKPAGTLATVRLHDWSHIKQQEALIASRGFSTVAYNDTSDVSLESFAKI